MSKFFNFKKMLETWSINYKPKNTLVQKGFTLIEIIIVLGIIGGLMVFVIRGLNTKGADIKKTAMTVSRISANMIRFQQDMGRLPTKAEGLASLYTNPGSSKWTGPYLEEEDTKDSWGHPLEYDLDNGKVKISSAGEDGMLGTADDLVYVNGKQLETEGGGAPAAGESAQ